MKLQSHYVISTWPMKMDRIQEQNIIYTWHEKIGQSRIAIYWNTGEEKLFCRANFSFYSH